MIRRLLLVLVVLLRESHTLPTATPSFNITANLKGAFLSTAAYCSEDGLDIDGLLAWKCGPACDAVPGVTDVRVVDSGEDNDALAITLRRQGRCTIVFRGTTGFSGFVADLEAVYLADFGRSACSGCKVGYGFLDNWESLKPYVMSNLTSMGCLSNNETLDIFGHSLGASEAALAAYDLASAGHPIGLFSTVGMPRVGDQAFATAFGRLMSTARTWRITHAQDPIVHLPTHLQGFTHIAQEVFFKGTTDEGFRMCDKSGEDDTCSNQFTDVPGLIAFCVLFLDDCDHMTYFTDEKAPLMDSSSCTNILSNAEPQTRRLRRR